MLLLVLCSLAQAMPNDGPPKPDNKAGTARWIANNNIWASFATISTIDKMKGEPFANIISFSEGLYNNSTGDIYFGVSDLDQSMIDIKNHNYFSLSMSEYQTNVCRDNKWDAEDPRCARLVFSGTFVKVDKKDSDYQGALNQLFKIHPEAREWFNMPSHDFYLAKLSIDNIWLIDFFGGPYTVPLKDYYAGKDNA